jgi:tRNA(Ile)-lysidine synthase TilS/MesJ
MVYSDLRKSPTINKYMNASGQVLQLYYPNISHQEIENILDYSVRKRYKKEKCNLDNNYTKQCHETTLLAMADYIAKREPIVTSYGTMFKNHTQCPNPMAEVVQSFLDLRSQHKKMMFKYPKGSEDFEKYNLLQSLDKIDANGIGIIWFNTTIMPPRVEKL